MTADLCQKVVGILGGGQLARMMAQQGQLMGIPVKILSPHKNDPAAQITSQWMKGDPRSLKDVKQFSKIVDCITFESEFNSEEVLKFLSDKSKGRAHPLPSLMKILQDRMGQKQLLYDHGLKTSPFVQVDSANDLKQIFSFPSVLKARRDGYDGKGTYIMKKANDSQAFKFVESQKWGVMAENFIPFQRELAFSVVRGPCGDIYFFPLVQSFQEDYRCLWVKGPIKHQGLSKLKSKVRKFVEAIDYYGVLSFELFDCKGELWINELAPRVHNTAHYSIDALTENQFSAHLKSVLGLPVRPPKLRNEGFAMMNLIGNGLAKSEGIITEQNVYTHWYGKDGNKKGRKMGHITAVSSTPGRALSMVERARKEIRL